MPDITMCKGGDCPMKESCYRFTATPSMYQSYFIPPPIKDGECEMYWGDQQKSIMEQLIKITNGKHNDI